jgi:hypothetical protein
MLPTIPRSKVGDALTGAYATKCPCDEIDQNLFHLLTFPVIDDKRYLILAQNLSRPRHLRSHAVIRKVDYQLKISLQPGRRTAD